MRIEKVRSKLTDRLRARRGEIEQTTLTRLYAVADPSETADPEYIDGLSLTVTAALDYALAALEHGQERVPPPPDTLLFQARLAARNGVNLDTVLRRYFAGYTLLSDFLVEEAERGGFLRTAELKALLHNQAALFDRIILAVSEEFRREPQGRGTSSEQRRVRRIECLLAGETVDVAELPYDFDAYHLGVICRGDAAEEVVRRLAADLDRLLLLVRRDEGTVWAWLGSRSRLDPIELGRRAAGMSPPSVRLALGEPGEGVAAWRLTHRQARAALPIALRGSDPVVRYADVALTAAIIQDDVLATSLRQLYLMPLERDRDGGEVARKTLWAYFEAGRNVSSAAAALGVKRHTVTNRLRASEELIGRPIDRWAAEIEAVLRLEELGGQTRPLWAEERGQIGRAGERQPMGG